MSLSGLRVLVIVGGGIAAYKVLEVVRRLKRQGAEVRCVLTQAGKAFVTPLSLSSLTQDRVYEDLFSLVDEAQMGHIRLAREADVILVAPATADLMAKMAHGLANDLASTLLLAAQSPIFMAPAMNVRMWHHAATQENLAVLRARGVNILGPAEGEMACGEYGLGRMCEAEEMIAALHAHVTGSFDTYPNLEGLRIIVTSGPTRESLDPIRYLSNRSSGRQGHAIAQAAGRTKAQVHLISGPVAIPDPPGVRVEHIESARDMWVAVQAALPADIFISAAAVADWRFETILEHKFKKGISQKKPPIHLVENVDILSRIGHLSKEVRPKLVIGFAAETERVVPYAQDKYREKGCDILLANDVRPENSILEGSDNMVHLITKTGIEEWPRLTKQEVARRLMHVCARALGRHS